MFEVAELNPYGRVYMPDLIPALVDRFRFQTFPSKHEELDQSKGLVFADGYYDGYVVDNLTIYSDGIKVDGRTDTETGQQLLLQTLEWLGIEHGLTYSPAMIDRWAYVSQVIVESQIDLDRLNPAVMRLAEMLSTELSSPVEARDFHAVDISIDIERTNYNPPIAAFTIQRRGKMPFSQHRYYSAAPLRTKVHLQLLKEFERNMMG